jgi:hypothetical protein
MNHTYVIRDFDTREEAALIVRTLSLSPVHEVTIRPYKRDRSAAQNALYWMWLTIIGQERGETKDDMHYEYKERFLVHIFERDDPEYAEMIEAVREVHRAGMKPEAKLLARQIVQLTSTTKANTHQFTEYLTDIERDAQKMNIRLPHPAERYRLAMGQREA